MSIKYLTIAATLAISPVALAQTTDPNLPNQAQQASPQAGETSDRTPKEATPTPLSQQDTADGETSDRSGNKDVKVQHHPGESTSSEGASTGEAGSNLPANSGSSTMTPSATPPAASGGTSSDTTMPPADPPAPSGATE